MTGDTWNAVRAARIPAAALSALAALRHRTDIGLIPQGDAVWVRWPEASPAALEALFPVPGVVFFIPKDGHWRRVHHRLPTADAPPDVDGRRLDSLLLPQPFTPLPPVDPDAPPMPIRLVPGGEPRSATALACPLAELAAWAESATTHELGSVRAARSDDRVLLLGARLPRVPNGVRHWGESLLVPLGFRIEPDLPPAVLREAIGAAPNELLLFGEHGTECISRDAFQPVTRASLRLALDRGGSP